MSEELVMIKQQIENSNEAIHLFGNNDIHLKRIEEELQVSIITRGEVLNVSGEIHNVHLVEEILEKLLAVIRKGISISERDVIYAIQMAKSGKLDSFEEL